MSNKPEVSSTPALPPSAEPNIDPYFMIPIPNEYTVSVSELQFKLSSTLNLSWEQRRPTVTTNRAIPSHLIIPTSMVVNGIRGVLRFVSDYAACEKGEYMVEMRLVRKEPEPKVDVTSPGFII